MTRGQIYLYGAVCLTFMLVITAQGYDRNQLFAEIERLKNLPVPAPQTIIKEVPTITERIIYRDSPPLIKEVIQTQEIIKEVPIYPALRLFSSVEELRAWLLNNQFVVLKAGADGVVNLLAPSGGDYDCEDYAAEIQDRARRDGYNIWQAPVTGGQVWGIRVSNQNEYHMGNMTRIGNTFYYIESSPPNQGNIVPLLNAD